MALVRISDNDLDGKVVMPLADVPGLSADAMKAKFEQIVREVVITKFNAAIDELNSFLYLGGNDFLKGTDLLSSYASIIANTEARKVPSAIGIKDMDAALKQKYATANYAKSETIASMSANTNRNVAEYEIFVNEASDNSPAEFMVSECITFTISASGNVVINIIVDGTEIASYKEDYATSGTHTMNVCKVVSFYEPGNHLVVINIEANNAGLS